MGFQSSRKLPLSIFGPFAEVSWCHGVTAGTSLELTGQHINTLSYRHPQLHLHTLSLFILGSLCLFLFISCFLSLTLSTCQHRSTGHDLSLTTTQNKKMESEPEGEWQFCSADAEIFGAFLLGLGDGSVLFVYESISCL